MDHRAPLLNANANRRPQLPQRAISGSSALHHAKPQARSGLPSRLSSVRSVSGPAANVVDLTLETPSTDARNQSAFLGNGPTLVDSPGFIDLSGEDEGPPTKRAKLVGHGFQAAGQGMSECDNMAYQAAPGSPLPNLPRQNVQHVKTVISRRRWTAANTAARRAQGSELPAIATRLPAPKNVADFCLWTGHHPEDQMNEAVVKAGYSDKGPGPNQSECNSAKPSVWQNLSSKNNMGLQILSTLYTQVLEKRQTLGRCLNPSTFKPPPRVTVTDTKREAWLRDLANPDIPLRKQSRTIPHGIRGKLLMEKCLVMDVPLKRAVWLGKCVGANELRAFRRKGVNQAAAASGESKWIRDWTMQVEQFLEGVVATCGRSDWQLRMSYAVKLAASFYAEKLLETDHYLDWIVSSFSDATMEKLPIWTIIVQIYWKEIVQSVKRGRCLAESILEKLYKITELGGVANSSIRARLQRLVDVLATTSRSCLVIPRTWGKYKHLLLWNAEKSDNAMSLANNLAMRNERLTAPLSKTPDKTRCALLDMIKELDSVNLIVDWTRLVQRCVALVPHTPELVSALLDWASSPFRTRTSRVHLSAGIIAVLHSMGVHTDAPILEYLARHAQRPERQLDNVYRVIGELVRNDCFSVAQYLKWLISAGVIYGGEQSRAAVALLAALPTDNLTHDCASLYRTLLLRSGISNDARAARAEAIARLDVAISTSAEAQLEKDVLSNDSRVSTTGSVAQHIRARLPVMMKDADFEVSTFCVLRNVLEIAEDMSTLAMLLRVTVDAAGPQLLTAIADTATFQARSLVALGELEAIVDSIDERYRTLRTHQSLDRTLISALTTLASLVAGRPVLANILGNDMFVCEQQSSIAVCSPASDSLVNMQAPSLESEEEINAVFASGNMMDDQVLQRVFSRIMQQSRKRDFSKNLVTSKLCEWLTQLRMLGNSTFDQLVANHVKLVMTSATFDSKAACDIAALVVSGCISLESVMHAAVQIGSSQTAISAIVMLSSGEPYANALSRSEVYRYQVMRKRYREEHSAISSKLMCMACANPGFPAEAPHVLELFCSLLVHDGDVFQRAIDSTPQDAQRQSTFGRMFYAIIGRASGHSTQQLDARAIADVADPLSVRFCTGALKHLFSTESATADSDKTTFGILKAAVERGNGVWPQLVGVASRNVQKLLHEHAREHLLRHTEDHVDRYLDLLDITRHAGSASEATIMAERLREVERRLNEPAAKVSDHLRILLHICAIQSDQAGAQEVVAAWSAILQHPLLPLDLREHISDVVSAVLPDAVRQKPPTDGWLALVQSQRPATKIPQSSSGSTLQQSRTKILSTEKVKTTPYPLRPWEIMPDAAPVMGENDASLSLGLFGARKA